MTSEIQVKQTMCFSRTRASRKIHSWIYVLLYSVCFAFICEPKIFTQYRITSLLFAIGNILIFAFFFTDILFTRKKLSKKIILFVVFRLYCLLAMLMNLQIKDLDQWGYLTVMVCNIIMLFDYSEKNMTSKSAIYSVWLVLGIYILINAITLLMFKRGIIPSNNIYDTGEGDYYFLGKKTTYTSYVFVFLAVSLFLFNKKKGIFWLIASVTISLFTLLYTHLATGIIGVAVFTLSLLLNKILKLNIKKCIIIGLIVCVLVVGFGVQNYLSFFIESILHKSVTLTSRVYIWNVAIPTTFDNFWNVIFGHGLTNSGMFVLVNGTYWQSHNQYLQYIFENGLVGSFLFILFALSCDIKTGREDWHYIILISMIFSIFICGVVSQVFEMAHIFILFCLVHLCKNMNKKHLSLTK